LSREEFQGSERAGIGKILFSIIIIVTVIISSSVTYALVTLSHNDAGQTSSSNSASLISGIADMFPVSVSTTNDTIVTSTNVTTTSCYSGNWSAIYAQYEAPLPVQQNGTNLGQQYLSDPQFMSFLSQYLNLNDPQVNATVRGLLSENETTFVSQQLQSQGLIC
jgi:hypothetical protein